MSGEGRGRGGCGGLCVEEKAVPHLPSHSPHYLSTQDRYFCHPFWRNTRSFLRNGGDGEISLACFEEPLARVVTWDSMGVGAHLAMLLPCWGQKWQSTYDLEPEEGL